MIETLLYHGLQWQSDDDRTSLTAVSRRTPFHYRIDHTHLDRIAATAELPRVDTPKAEAPWSRVRIGIFRDLELAMLAAERHDFAFVRSLAEAAGKTLVFVGSDAIRPLAEALAREEALEAGDGALTDLLVDDHVLPNGRPFRRLASYFDATKTSAKQEKDGSHTLAINVAAADLPLWLFGSPHGVKLAVGLIPLDEPAGNEDSWSRRGAEAFTRSHVLPRDPSFQEWLLGRYDRWGLIAAAMARDSDEVAKQVLETTKRLVGIASRRDLHADRDAIEKLEKLDREYYKDMARAAGIFVPSISEPRARATSREVADA